MEKRYLNSNPVVLSSHEKLNAMMAYWDKDLICRFANESYLDWFGFAPKDMINKMTFKDLLGTSYESNLVNIEGVLGGVAQIFTRLLVIKSGELKKVVAAYYPDMRNGVTEGFFAHVFDVTDLNNVEIEKTIYEIQTMAASNHKMATKSIADDLHTKRDSKMVEVAATLKDHLLGKFPGLNYLADRHYISVSKLKRDFKLAYNVSPYTFYNILKMEYADEYMKHNKCSKKEVAAMLDFSNPSTFYASFKKYKKSIKS